ncbi:MAG: response regulator [Pontibacterium sp.]
MSGELQHRLRQLRHNFAKQLPDRLKEFDELWAGLDAGLSDNSLNALIQLCHKLAGSSGTFGFMGLSEQARLLETQLEQLKEGQAPTPEQSARLQNTFKHLHNAAHSDGAAIHVPAQQADRLKPLALRPVYIVDDDLQQCEFIASGLSNHGYTVKICEDLTGLEAMIAGQQPGAIIMDLSFPQGPMAGSDLIARIKSKQLLQIPVIFVSSHNSMSSRLQAVRAGGDAYFAKPLKPAELLESLDYLVAKSHSEPYKILIVDDDVELAEFHATILKAAGLDVAVLGKPLEVLEAISTFKPELLLLDLHMPECTGIELANLLRQHKAYINLPIVFLSAEEDARKHLEARLVGADDFLIKPVDEEFLIAAVVNRVHRARSAEQLITRDSMTALLNHETLLTEMERQILLAQRENTELSFCMFDIDHFKDVNDNYGHMIGDTVIKSFADLLKGRLRRTDHIGRYGGEEFAVLMPDTSLKQAEEVALLICRQFSKFEHYCGEATFKVTVSGGIAQLSDYNGKIALLEAADHALYAAKKGGRNQIILNQP